MVIFKMRVRAAGRVSLTSANVRGIKRNKIEATSMDDSDGRMIFGGQTRQFYITIVRRGDMKVLPSYLVKSPRCLLMSSVVFCGL